jgi:hypothetical protein
VKRWREKKRYDYERTTSTVDSLEYGTVFFLPVSNSRTPVDRFSPSTVHGRSSPVMTPLSGMHAVTDDERHSTVSLRAADSDSD